MISIIQNAQYKEICKKNGLDPEKIPTHVAIIMDGNGRWAKKRLKERTFGHKEGAEALRRTIKTAVELGIKIVSVYAFSTENWKRPKTEVEFLINYIQKLITKETPTFLENKVQVRFLGKMSELPKKLQDDIAKTEATTASLNQIRLNILLNYGSRDEILSSIQTLAKSNPNWDNLTQEDLNKYLYTNAEPDPDIIIRTGGEKRLSNFLLWQAAYSELFFIDTLWPDFEESHLIDILKNYQARDRRFGGLLT